MSMYNKNSHRFRVSKKWRDTATQIKQKRYIWNQVIQVVKIVKSYTKISYISYQKSYKKVIQKKLYLITKKLYKIKTKKSYKHDNKW